MFYSRQVLDYYISFIRFSNTFWNWDSFIVIHDDSIDLAMEIELYNVIAPNVTLSMFRLDTGWDPI